MVGRWGWGWGVGSEILYDEWEEGFTRVRVYPFRGHNLSSLQVALHQIAPKRTNQQTFCSDIDAHNAYPSANAHFIVLSILFSHTISMPPSNSKL